MAGFYIHNYFSFIRFIPTESLNSKIIYNSDVIYGMYSNDIAIFIAVSPPFFLSYFVTFIKVEY